MHNYSGKTNDVNRMLSLIEDMLPTESIQTEKSKGSMKNIEMDYEVIKNLFNDALSSTNSIGKSKVKAIEDLTFYEPFSSYKDQLKKDFL